MNTRLVFIPILIGLIGIYYSSPYFLSLNITQTQPPRILIIVGGGLAGTSAALSASSQNNNNNNQIILIESTSKLGGNSNKASSGINGTPTKAQKRLGIENDSIELFINDTLKSGRGDSSSELVRDVLIKDSGAAVDWLENEHGIDFTLISKCGGHSAARTHRTGPLANGRATNVGNEIMKSVIRAVYEDPSITVLLNTKLEKLVSSFTTGRISGVEVSTSTSTSEAAGNTVIRGDAVILATGGFAANPEMVREYMPDLANLATTNGPWARGEGMIAAEKVGASLIQMENIQVHPTGLVNPTDPNSATKFLGPEALRASGAILINGLGKRFTNELGLRDEVTSAVIGVKVIHIGFKSDCRKVSSSVDIDITP